MLVSPSFQMLFTRAAAARILNVKPHTIKIIVAEKDGVVVQVNNENQVIPIQKFAEDFSLFRRAGAKNLTSVPVVSHVYSVFNPKKGTSYQVQTKSKGLICQCEDWKGSKAAFGQGICKHSYRVLFDLGFMNLAEYLEAMKDSVEQVPVPNSLSLENMKLPKLKELAIGWGITPVGDKRYRKTWITALKEHACNQVSNQALTDADRNEQNLDTLQT